MKNSMSLSESPSVSPPLPGRVRPPSLIRLQRLVDLPTRWTVLALGLWVLFRTRDQGDLVPAVIVTAGYALVTIGLKSSAWLMTGSVGLLSDAAESLVNLVAAWALSRANRQSLNVEGAYLHALADLLSSLLAALAGVVIVTTGFDQADPIAALLVCAVMVRGGWRLLRDDPAEVGFHVYRWTGRQRPERLTVEPITATSSSIARRSTRSSSRAATSPCRPAAGPAPARSRSRGRGARRRSPLVVLGRTGDREVARLGVAVAPTAVDGQLRLRARERLRLLEAGGLVLRGLRRGRRGGLGDLTRALEAAVVVGVE